MFSIYSISVLSVILFSLFFFLQWKWPHIFRHPYAIIAFAAIAIRLLCLTVDPKFVGDLNIFKLWAQMLGKDGMSTFYTSETLTDLPPGYMYVLYVIGKLGTFLNIPNEGFAFTAMIKAPAIICDVITCIFIYKLAAKKLKPNYSLILALAYALNPSIMLDSAIWGNIDTVYTLVLIISIYLLTENRYLPSFLLFALNILIKPQGFIFTPIYLYAAFEYVKSNKYSIKSFITIFFYGVLSLALLFDLMLPFTKGFNLRPVINQYISTISSYPYASVNAYNFFAFIGANWVNVANKFLILPYSTWGYVFIEIIVLFVVYLLLTRPGKSNYFFITGVLNALTFMFSARMHERYIFPSIVLFILAYVYKRDKKLLVLAVGFSTTLFLNCYGAIETMVDGNSIFHSSVLIPFVSFINLILTGFMLYTAVTLYKRSDGEAEQERSVINEDEIKTIEEPKKPRFETKDSEPSPKLNKLDFIAISVIMLIYGVIAFINLGDTKAPQTFWHAGEEQSVVIDLGEQKSINELRFLPGYKENGVFAVEVSNDGNYFDNYTIIGVDAVFRWQLIPLELNGRYVRLTVDSPEIMIMELGLYDENGIITPTDYNSGSFALFDEQDLIPDVSYYKNSSYFDEIYHARAGFELVNKLPIYETTHPPLGKNIIALGIKMFGMTPFGYRFMGTLFGVLMLPLLYLLAKGILKTTFWASFVTFIFAFDFMHFAQTRISTIDTYVVIFVIAMYYFMYRYYSMNFYKDKLSKTLVPLSLSGLFMGLAVASKWQGAYAATGLAFIFFYSLYLRYKEAASMNGKRKKEYFEAFCKNSGITIACCLVFFIVIPVLIYCLSYIPVMNVYNVNSIGSAVSGIIHNQQSMFSYHSGLTDTHAYSSPWWSWLLNIRPTFYYTRAATADGSIVEGISSFGNPLVWLGGLVAMGMCVAAHFKKYSKDIVFMLAAFLSSLLPWVLIPRVSFIYHYFPCVPFLALFIGYVFKNYGDFDEKKSRKAALIFAAATLLLFVIFYPVLSGLAVPMWYVKLLRWVPNGWILAI